MSNFYFHQKIDNIKRNGKEKQKQKQNIRKMKSRD